ncbi:hypothetical protein [Parendozoicomonas sp. Alg238-R29]|uniref:hypothetical protein n=1 Tax=Parendozoicomonas sp. Alg238-R29 TaxID=2993446 RepID=UPI00248D8E56|nr:hypothetical protein [Parendozoicomonas sp. Alg238-R29]
MNPLRSCLLVLTLVALAGCNTSPYRNGYPSQESWAVLPVQSLQSEEAGIQIERMLTVLLAAKGVKRVELPPETETQGNNSLIESAHRLKNSMQWANQHGIKLGITGTLHEYKKVADGRFTMDLSLNLIDIKTGEIIWSISGRGEGRPEDDPISVGRNLVNALLSGLPLTENMAPSGTDYWLGWVPGL